MPLDSIIPQPIEILNYSYKHITSTEDVTKFISSPHRLDCLTMLLCHNGTFDISIDTRQHTIKPDTLVCLVPGMVVTVVGISSANIEIEVLMLSKKFIPTLNFDVNVISTVHFDPATPPILKISHSDMKLMKSYFDLMRYNDQQNTEPIYAKSISRNLFTAAAYQMMQLARKYENSQPAEEADSASNMRAHNYVRDFMNLVALHHQSERNVSFYASQLYLSPKYLSHIIKRATGRSAAQWIDHYVIVQAKNLLRYSGKNIQQVAYHLNFPNQSAFGKYFKHLTGMSPSQFQRS